MKKVLLLLSVLLIGCTTTEVSKPIMLELPERKGENIDIPEIHKKNIFVVLINKNDKVLAGIGSPSNMVEINGDGSINSSLKESVKTFVSNNGRLETSSESPEKAVVSLQNQEGTSYDMYIQIQNELTKAYNELRDEKSNQDYGKDFDKLDTDEQKLVKKYFPMKVSVAETKSN